MEKPNIKPKNANFEKMKVLKPVFEKAGTITAAMIASGLQLVTTNDAQGATLAGTGAGANLASNTHWENTLIGYNFGMELANNMTLIFKGSKTYVFEDDGYKSIKNTQIETSIYF